MTYTISFQTLWEFHKSIGTLIYNPSDVAEVMNLVGITLKHSVQDDVNYYDAYASNTNILVGCDGESFDVLGIDDDVVYLENEGIKFYISKEDFIICATKNWKETVNG